MRIDEAQFASIYDQFAPKIFKFCYFRVSSREEAEDIVSQVFFRAWDYVVAGKEVKNVQGFLYRIASNLIIDYYRKHKDKREVSLDDPANPIDIPDASNMVDRIDQNMMISDVRYRLEQLPENYREVIVLKFINELSIKEIAEVMQTTENNISVRLHRAIEKIKSIA